MENLRSRRRGGEPKVQETIAQSNKRDQEERTEELSSHGNLWIELNKNAVP